MERFLTTEEIEAIEREHANGLSLRTLLELFQPLGGRVSEATFRKYVQAGLLPRSRRVGRKGKHMGSQGLYPVDVVRRLNLIRKAMSEGRTLEQIRNSFLSSRGEIDELARLLEALLKRHEEALESGALPSGMRQDLELALEALREDGRSLIRRFEQLASLARRNE